ncbi:poly(beta-D-mannuronate) lyase [Gillisia sp. Hel_I_86]|uniref:chondroitinase-B domain-containing protein n=1 Tax=Gillisia sp. Hel_I_86 TaxID=1249981 RepID=UPI001199B6E1|nr:chondroitinase-B domain-containing protein [Gillisia sp. Hel_I_86]TVZ26683.1 poly(beta-D-mannuronate) lyase [Gillisia sp. Hel_I_86]
MKYIFLTLLLFFSGINFAQKASNQQILVKNITEYNSAVDKAKPGDVITLANGVWKDAELIFKGQGTKDQPITLNVEDKGKVTIEGKSSLKLAGEHLIVDGLYFTNGYTPSNSVIQFKVDNEHIANHSRVTNCVIENFTQPSRDVQDHWIEFWGRNNQMDHCYIAGKSNSGPTLRVFLKGNENINTHHQIINNYFGPRPRKGGPHGETLQIGSSETSMTPAYVNVSENLFYRCNGEVEIISSKSNFNEFKHNVFFESEGSLVLRHGNYAKIDGNVFIGNDNSEFIGGIRVINTGHWITNNYFYKLKGSEFRSPLAVMNGIPKSPLNRYNQVTDVVAAFNTYVNCISPWHFSVGSNVAKSDVLPASEIRSARPERVLLANNLIYNDKEQKFPVVAYDTIDGVSFKKNILNSPNESEIRDKGIITRDFKMKKINEYLYVPVENQTDIYSGFDFEKIEEDIFGKDRRTSNSIGAISLPVHNDQKLFEISKYGPDWYTPINENRKAEVFQVSTSEELLEAVQKMASGDIIEIKSGAYKLDVSIPIDKKITIQSKSEENRAILQFSGNNSSAAFEMNPGGVLKLENIILKGTKNRDAFGTLDKNMSSAYNLWVDNSEISDFNSLLKVSQRSFADTISIANSTIKDLQSGINLAEETDDKGEYNAEFVYIINSKFENIKEEILNYYRGGYDESTIGGNLVLTGNTFKNSGTSEDTDILLKTRGIVNVEFSNNSFLNNPVKFIAILWGEKGQKPENNSIKNSGEIKVEENLKQKLMY